MRHHATTIAILALAWLIPTTAQAATINYPMPVSGPHTADLDQAIISNERVWTQSGTTYHTRDVYLPNGDQLLGQEYLDDGPEGAGWYSWLVNRRTAWGTQHNPQRYAPDVQPDRCATVNLPRFGWAKVIELKGRCRGIVRRARHVSRRFNGLGKQSFGPWKCVVSAGGAHCHTGDHFENRKHVTLRRVTREDALEQRSVRRRKLTRCGRADKIKTMIVWTRRADCRTMLRFGLAVAQAYGLESARPHLTGWDCGRVRSAWICKQHRRLVIFQPARRAFPEGLSVVKGPWGGAYVLSREP